jgi:hypothetical protein
MILLRLPTRLWAWEAIAKAFDMWQQEEIVTNLERHFISYPKSGRTWIRFMLEQVGVTDRIVFHHDNFEFSDGSRPAHNFSVSERLDVYNKIDRIVYLERDPRDVMVSLYHQVTGRFGDVFAYRGTISEFLHDPYFGAINLQRFRKIWEELCQQPNVLKITYEECHHDPAQTLIKTLDFYGFPYSKKDIATAIEASSFDKMKELEDSGQFHEPWLRRRNDAPKVREGRIGGFKDAVDHRDIVFLNRVLGLPSKINRFEAIKRLFRS